jgi:peptide/nickel transport system permease protein
MSRYLVHRTLEALLVLAVMSFVVYGLIGLMPGDPIDLMVAGNPKLTSEDIARLKAVMGLDRPLLDRYGNWLLGALQGDLGYSRLYAQPVQTVLLGRLGNTALLMLSSFALALATAIPIGVYAATRPRSFADGAVNLLCFAGISVPPFWLALVLILVFAAGLGWLPASGIATIGAPQTGVGWLIDRLRHLALPVMTLTLASIGSYARFVRAGMLEALRQDYVRTARAKGASRRRVVWGHALRNAMIPIVTVVALSFGGLFSGALITETMFAYLGMGKLIYDAILGNDYNLALVGLLFATALTLAANITADVAYTVLDPRVALE